METKTSKCSCTERETPKNDVAPTSQPALTLLFLSVQSRAGAGFLSLSRCAACYNHKKSSTSWLGGDGESSSSAEDSGPDVESESEAESSSSSSSSSSQESLLEEPGGDGPEETKEEPEEEQKSSQRAPLSRPDTIVSTLNLQVLPQKHHTDDFRIVKVAEEAAGAEGGGHQHLQAGSPWQQWPHPPVHQQQLSQQHHMMQLQPRLVTLPTAGGQRSAPGLPGPAMMHPPRPPHPALWAPSASQPHLEGPRPQHCWYCRSAPY